MWPWYCLLVAQIWNTGVDRPGVIIHTVCGPDESVWYSPDLGQNNFATFG